MAGRSASPFGARPAETDPNLQLDLFSSAAVPAAAEIAADRLPRLADEGRVASRSS